MGNPLGFSFAFFAIVTALLSCCCSPASSFAFLPRVSRTNDAVIIDFAGLGDTPFYYGKTLYGQIANPGFVPVPPSFNPHPMAYRQQNPNGWSYSFGYASPNALAEDPVPSARQGGAAPAVAPAAAPAAAPVAAPAPAAATTTTTTPAPAIQCGKGPTALPTRSFISERVGGTGATAAKANAWPFIVTLRKSSADAGVYFCSGTLISDSKVLLAANCLEKMSLFDISGVTVLIGLSPASDGTSPPNIQMTRRIGKVVLHSRYNAFTFANDIAIITLDAPVVLSRSVGTVCLPPTSPDPDQYVDQSAVIIGWGTKDSSASSALNQGTVAVSSNSDCKADTNFGKYVTDANICISAVDKFVCPGDIGGPVVVLTSPGTWTLIGINSFSPTGCTANSLQTRVAAFRAWIDLYSTN